MKQILDAIFPKRCLSCDLILGKYNDFLCLKCLNNLPYTYWGFNDDNPLFETFHKHKVLYKASALLRFESGNTTQKLLHANKYFNQPKIGEFLGKLSINMIMGNNIDVVISVPSNIKTKRKRNYNQVDEFAKTIAKGIGADFLLNALERTGRTKSQIQKNKIERLDVLSGSFKIIKDMNQYNHVLLVDDLITSGATITANLLEIQKKYKGKLSVFSMAKVI